MALPLTSQIPLLEATPLSLRYYSALLRMRVMFILSVYFVHITFISMTTLLIDPHLVLFVIETVCIIIVICVRNDCLSFVSLQYVASPRYILTRSTILTLTFFTIFIITPSVHKTWSSCAMYFTMEDFNGQIGVPSFVLIVAAVVSYKSYDLIVQ
jgi:hypothetical protein